jgi:flagellar operon protein
VNRLDASFSSIEQVQNQYLSDPLNRSSSKKNAKVNFNDILSKKINDAVGNASEIRFSKHAIKRLSDRSISLTPEQSERLKDGVRKADAKGINESLVMVDDLAFIVNVPSKTVVTAMDDDHTGQNVFTNIDGAVIV